MGENEDIIIRKVSNLLATAFLYSGSPTLMDRFANALSKDALSKVLYDIQRVVEVGIENNEIKTTSIKTERGGGGGVEYNTIEIIAENEGNKQKKYTIIGYLPSNQDIERFLNMIERDVYYARKASALAMSTVNRQKLNQGGEEE